MSEADAAKRLRWAFGLALLLHAAALGAATRLPDAVGDLSQEFEEIRVFGSASSTLMSRVELVEWPAEAPAGEAVQLVALRPESAEDPASQRDPVELVTEAPPPRAPQAQSVRPTAKPVAEAPEQTAPAVADTTPAEVKALPVEKPRPANGGPAGGGGGGGGGFVDLGSPSANATLDGVPSGGTPAGEAPGQGTGTGAGVGPGAGGGSGGGSGGGTGIGEGTGVGEGSGSGTGGGVGVGDGDGDGAGGGFNSRVAERREPEVVWKGELEYPASAVRDGVEGTVRLKVLVSEKGAVAAAELLESSGDRRLDAAAQEFVRGWRYRPAVQDGEPRQVHTHATVRFELN